MSGTQCFLNAGAFLRGHSPTASPATVTTFTSEACHEFARKRSQHPDSARSTGRAMVQLHTWAHWQDAKRVPGRTESRSDSEANGGEARQKGIIHLALSIWPTKHDRPHDP